MNRRSRKLVWREKGEKKDEGVGWCCIHRLGAVTVFISAGPSRSYLLCLSSFSFLQGQGRCRLKLKTASNKSVVYFLIVILNFNDVVARLAGPGSVLSLFVQLLIVIVILVVFFSVISSSFHSITILNSYWQSFCFANPTTFLNY